MGVLERLRVFPQEQTERKGEKKEKSPEKNQETADALRQGFGLSRTILDFSKNQLDTSSRLIFGNYIAASYASLGMYERAKKVGIKTSPHAIAPYDALSHMPILQVIRHDFSLIKPTINSFKDDVQGDAIYNALEVLSTVGATQEIKDIISILPPENQFQHFLQAAVSEHMQKRDPSGLFGDARECLSYLNPATQPLKQLELDIAFLRAGQGNALHYQKARATFERMTKTNVISKEEIPKFLHNLSRMALRYGFADDASRYLDQLRAFNNPNMLFDALGNCMIEAKRAGLTINEYSSEFKKIADSMPIEKGKEDIQRNFQQSVLALSLIDQTMTPQGLLSEYKATHDIDFQIGSLQKLATMKQVLTGDLLGKPFEHYIKSVEKNIEKEKDPAKRVNDFLDFVEAVIQLRPARTDLVARAHDLVLQLPTPVLRSRYLGKVGRIQTRAGIDSTQTFEQCISLLPNRTDLDTVTEGELEAKFTFVKYASEARDLLLFRASEQGAQLPNDVYRALVLKTQNAPKKEINSHLKRLK